MIQTGGRRERWAGGRQFVALLFLVGRMEVGLGGSEWRLRLVILIGNYEHRKLLDFFVNMEIEQLLGEY